MKVNMIQIYALDVYLSSRRSCRACGASHRTVPLSRSRVCPAGTPAIEDNPWLGYPLCRPPSVPLFLKVQAVGVQGIICNAGRD